MMLTFSGLSMLDVHPSSGGMGHCQDPGDLDSAAGRSGERRGAKCGSFKHRPNSPSASSRVSMELLILIFDFAATRPGISWNAYLRWAPDVYWRPYVGTAKALTLVCKSWHEPAMEILYRGIVLNSVPSFPLLYRTLATSTGDRGKLPRSLSMICPVSNVDIYAMTVRYLNKILRLCPNLKHVTFSQHELLAPVTFRYDPVGILSTMSLAAHRLTSLRLDDGWTVNSLNHVPFLQDCVNLETMSILWPVSVECCTGLIALPRLHTLTLIVYGGPSSRIITDTVHPPDDAVLSLPTLHTLTLSFECRPTNRVFRGARPKKTVLELLSSYGNTLRRFHLNIMPLLPTGRLSGHLDDMWRDEFKDVASDQEFIDLCPGLEHYITFTSRRLELSHHASLRYVDAWVPSFSLNDTYEDPKTEFFGNSGGFPSLVSFRILDVSLCVFSELPFIISPDTVIPKDEHYAAWHFGSLPIAQTQHAVTWLNHYEYNSDSDSSYFYSSPSDSSSDEDPSDTAESVSDAQEPEVMVDPEEWNVDREVERDLEVLMDVYLEF
ncbi:hypothetical protein EVG20_g10069 [Dentipellis fragilis]|uniref:F-box domain-containing protein n=1 Tax=Dentipellis fragilis TaxID=205917 RepID=A0A4Y9XY96_9AGAM|nr:hypothetical protein EVG20_g10069 [Dentipellis fragilis]